MNKKLSNNKFTRTAKYTVYFLVSWFVIHTVAIAIDGLTDEKEKTEFGVILGNKVNADGSLSKRLIKRLDKGIELYNDSTIRLIFVSGGFGKEGFYEGTKMAEYLIGNNIPGNKIIIDNAGITTQSTAENFSKLKSKSTSVTVISQYYHISRTKLAFRNKGFKNVKGAHADYFELRDFYAVIREFFGYYKYLIFG
jgi:vancomycin permeability regulator SanA